MTSRSFEPGFRAGGPIRSLARIVDTLPADVELLLVTNDRDLGCREPYDGLSGNWLDRGSAAILYLNVRRSIQWFKLCRRLRAFDADVLYCNSLWDPVFTILFVLAVRLRVVPADKILIAPRGELSGGALTQKQGKKKAFLVLWIRVLAHKSTVWHASTHMETADIRRVWPEATVEEVEDQTCLPMSPLELLAMPEGPLQLVFISRISPHKNLALVLTALRETASSIDFDIYGPIEDERYWFRCQSIIGQLPRNVRVRYRGELGPEGVRVQFAKYDAFMFPTAGENFGHVIAESLSASCPVICSDLTPWTPVLSEGGGRVLKEVTADAISVEIRHLANRTYSERQELKRQAAAAYRRWRLEVKDENILSRFGGSGQSVVTTFND